MQNSFKLKLLVLGLINVIIIIFFEFVVVKLAVSIYEKKKNIRRLKF